MSDGWLLGIEIGGTKLQLGLARPGEPLLRLRRLQVDPLRGASGICDQIHSAFQSLLADETLSRDAVVAAGVGFGGPVDTSRGVVLKSFQIDGWVDFPLAEWIRRELELPAVEIQNDADTAGLAEARFGAGIGHSPLVYMTIGSGIGGALIIDDRIYRGAGLGAMEIGHMHVPDGRPSAAATAELEQVASGWGISRAAREAAVRRLDQGRSDWMVLQLAGGRSESITSEHVARAALAGEPLAVAILERARRALAFAIQQAVTLLGPRRIILGGGVSMIGEEAWFSPIRDLVAEHVLPQFRGTFDIVPAALGEAVVVHGALALAADALQSHRDGRSKA